MVLSIGLYQEGTTVSMGVPSAGGSSVVAGGDWQDWVRTHTRQATVGIGVVTVLAATVYLYFASAKRKEAFAAQALAQAWATVEAGNIPLAANDLSRLVERFGGTRSADEGAILLNELRLLQGQNDPAVEALRAYVRSGRPGYVQASAWGLLGGGLENQNKPLEAAEAYRRAAEAATYDFLKAQYLIDAGRAFTAAGDTSAAREAYGELLRRYGELAQAAEARVRMAEIGGAVPEVPMAPLGGTRGAS